MATCLWATWREATIGGAAWSSDLLGLIGLLILAWPAFKIDRIGRRIGRIRRVAETATSNPAGAEATSNTAPAPNFWAKLAQGVIAELTSKRDDWTPVSRILLWLGFGVSVVSALMKVIRC